MIYASKNMSVLRIHVSLNSQKLQLINHDEILKEYSVSTSKKGGGSLLIVFRHHVADMLFALR